MPDRTRPSEPAELERVASNTARTAAVLVADALAARTVTGAASTVARTVRDAGRLVRELLVEATPLAGFADAAGAATAPSAPLQWVVDPLGGPVNFAHAIPMVAVSVAAALDGEVVAGAVVDVLRAERFSAHLGGGARSDGRPIGASACGDLGDALVATGCSAGPPPRSGQGEVVSRVLAAAGGLRCFGSTALELCWVGSGRLDGSFERGVRIQRYAAAALIAEEAGAVVELACPENDDLVIAAAPGVFEALRAVVVLPAARAAP